MTCNNFSSLPTMLGLVMYLPLTIMVGTESAPDLLQNALIAQPLHRCPGDTGRIEVAAARDAALTYDLKGTIAVTRSFHEQ